MYLCVCIRQPNRKWKLNLRAVRRACNPSTGEPESGGPGDQGHYLATYGVWGLPKDTWGFDSIKKKLHKKEKSTKICVLHKFTQSKYHFPCLKWIFGRIHEVLSQERNIVPLTVLEENLQFVGYCKGIRSWRVWENEEAFYVPKQQSGFKYGRFLLLFQQCLEILRWLKPAMTSI